MKHLRLFLRSCLVLVILLASQLASAQATHTQETPFKKGLFLSLNTSGSGMQGRGEYLSYVIFTIESGKWVNDKFLAGISAATPWLTNNMGIRQNYRPFEANVFAKYYPFKKSGMKWLGVHSRAGVSNSGMGLEDPEEKLYTNLSFGPSVNLGKRSGFAFNTSVLFDVKLGASALNKFVIMGQPWGLSGYIGLSYTFKERE